MATILEKRQLGYGSNVNAPEGNQADADLSIDIQDDYSICGEELCPITRRQERGNSGDKSARQEQSDLETNAKDVCTKYTVEDNRCLAAISELSCKQAFSVIDPKTNDSKYALTACGICMLSDAHYDLNQCQELQSGDSPMLKARILNRDGHSIEPRFSSSAASNRSYGISAKIVDFIVIVALVVPLVTLFLALKIRKSRSSRRANQGQA